MLSRYRKIMVVVVGVALLLGVTAGPLSAAKPINKIYQVTVNPSILVGGTQTVTVTYTNVTPGVSSFNSLTLTVPTTGGYQIPTSQSVAVHDTADGSNTTVQPSATAPNITVTNLFPVGYEQSVTLKFQVTVPSLTTWCNPGDTWITMAWTGSNTSGSLFNLDPSVPAPTTSVGGSLGSTPYSQTLDNNDVVTVTNLGTTSVPMSVCGGTGVNITKPSMQVPLTVGITWTPEKAQSPLTTWTQVSDTANPTLHDIQWCNGTWDSTNPTDVSKVTLPLLAGSTTIREVSCLLQETSQIYGPDTNGNQQVQVHDLIYLLGDWGAQR
jgi:hypothetical protein